MANNFILENKTIFLEDTLINYTLIKRKVKNMRIEFGSDGFKVIIPLNCISEVPFLKKHSKWILKRYNSILKINSLISSLNNQLIFFGETFKIQNKQEFNINFEEKTIIIDETDEKHKKMLKSILFDKLYILVKILADNYSNKLNTSYKSIKIRRQKCKWGSYSTNGIICFNFALAFVPYKLIKYIVFHEVAHSKVLKHNSKFWKMIDEEFSDRKQIEKELSDYWLICNKMMNRLW